MSVDFDFYLAHRAAREVQANGNSRQFRALFTSLVRSCKGERRKKAEVGIRSSLSIGADSAELVQREEAIRHDSAQDSR